MDPIREIDAVHGARHADIGENEFDLGFVFEYVDGFARARSFENAKSALGQTVRKREADEHLVFGNQDRGSFGMWCNQQHGLYVCLRLSVLIDNAPQMLRFPYRTLNAGIVGPMRLLVE